MSRASATVLLSNCSWLFKQHSTTTTTRSKIMKRVECFRRRRRPLPLWSVDKVCSVWEQWTDMARPVMAYSARFVTDSHNNPGQLTASWSIDWPRWVKSSSRLSSARVLSAHAHNKWPRLEGTSNCWVCVTWFRHSVPNYNSRGLFSSVSPYGVLPILHKYRSKVMDSFYKRHLVLWPGCQSSARRCIRATLARGEHLNLHGLPALRPSLSSLSPIVDRASWRLHARCCFPFDLWLSSRPVFPIQPWTVFFEWPDSSAVNCVVAPLPASTLLSGHIPKHKQSSVSFWISQVWSDLCKSMATICRPLTHILLSTTRSLWIHLGNFTLEMVNYVCNHSIWSIHKRIDNFLMDKKQEMWIIICLVSLNRFEERRVVKWKVSTRTLSACFLCFWCSLGCNGIGVYIAHHHSVMMCSLHFVRQNADLWLNCFDEFNAFCSQNIDLSLRSPKWDTPVGVRSIACSWLDPRAVNWTPKRLLTKFALFQWFSLLESALI